MAGAADYIKVVFRDGVAPLATTQTGTDITADVKSLRIQRGGLSDPGRFNGATGTMVLDNRDGKYSPLNPSSSFWGYGAGVTALQRWASFVIFYSDPGGTGSADYWSTLDSNPELCVLYAVDWELFYPVSASNQATTRVQLVDAFGFLGRLELDDSFVAAQAHDRVDDILDAVGSSGWPAALRDVDTLATTELPALDLSDAPQNALQLLQDTASACGGWCYVGQSGKVTFRSRHYWNATDASLQRANGSNIPVGSQGPMVDPADFGAIAVSFAKTRSQVFTGAMVSNVGGTVASTGQALTNYPNDILSRTGLQTRDAAEVTQLAQWWADAHSLRETWLESVDFHFYPENAEDATARTMMFDDLGTGVVVRHTAPGEVLRDHYGVIVGIEHRVTPDRWDVRWTVAPWDHFTANLLPARAATDDQCVYFPNSGSTTVSTPDAAALDLSADFTFVVQFVDWDDQANDYALIIHKGFTAPNAAYYLYKRNAANGGLVGVFWSSDGTASSEQVFQATQDYLQPGLWLKCESTVSGTRTTEWYVSDDGSTWGDPVETDTGGATTINANTVQLVVGGHAISPTSNRYTGRIGRVLIYDGTESGGTLVADMDPSEATPGAASWTGATPSQTWTVNGDAVLEELGVFVLGDRLGTKVLSY